MKSNRNTILPLAALLAFASVAPAAELTVQEQIDALKARIAELDAKVRPLQRAETTAGDKGFILAAPDASTSLRIRSLIQVDSRWFGDGNVNNNDALLLRRGRIGLEGKLNKTTEYQITGEYAGSSASILDANVTLTYSPEVQIKLGRFKTPVGLEQLQSDAAALFIERSLVSQIAPNRDIGVQLGGEFSKGEVSYAIGLFNGIQDGGNNSDQKDANDGKDIAARVTFQPWINEEGSALAGLSFGLGGSYGLQDTNAAIGTKYKSDGQQDFFAYRSTVFSTGRVSRYSPQVSYYNGSLSVLGEYIASTSEVGLAAGSKTKLKNTAWQLATGYVLTGEKASYKGVTPANDFDRAAGSWGAFEVVARVAVLDIDDAAFTTFADPAASATKATSFAIGANWYLSKVSRLSLDFTHTKFDLTAGSTPAATSPIKNDENAILARYQLNF
jgi:phosphate-selective porin OprO and OprP